MKADNFIYIIYKENRPF